MGQQTIYLDDALKRDGVSVTHKNNKGFQLLQITWSNLIMNAAYYYLMLIANTLYESYKEDVVIEAEIPTGGLYIKSV